MLMYIYAHVMHMLCTCFPGIHLNVIEAADDPAEESWANINAINDVIKSLAAIHDKVVVSALQSGAGAGGVMMAAAADLVWARQVRNKQHYPSKHATQ